MSDGEFVGVFGVGLVVVSLLAAVIAGSSGAIGMANLAPFADATWVTDNPWGHTVPDAFYGVTTEAVTTHNGSYTFKLEPDTDLVSGSFNFWIVPAVPGDHVVIKCWMKTGGAVPVDFCGARFGLTWVDVGHSNIVDASSELMVQNGVHHDDEGVNANYVKWGNDWTERVWNFTVPATVSADGSYGGYAHDDPGVPAHFVPWCQVWCSPPDVYPDDAFTCYFSDFRAYVNQTLASASVNLMKMKK